MTRVLYIPTGDCLKFLRLRGVEDKVSYTETYENSLVARSGKPVLEFIQYLIASDKEISFKIRNGIPTHGRVFIEEFEII